MSWFTYFIYHSSYKCIWINLLPNGTSLSNSQIDVITNITTFVLIFGFLFILTNLIHLIPAKKMVKEDKKSLSISFNIKERILLLFFSLFFVCFSEITRTFTSLISEKEFGDEYTGSI